MHKMTGSSFGREHCGHETASVKISFASGHQRSHSDRNELDLALLI